MTSQKQQLNEQKMINHLSTVGILGNVILTAFKLLAGIIGHSGAMISDAVHSLSDVFATFIAFLGVKLSKKSADSEHPYGHDRLECVASMVLAAILLATGIGIGMSGVKTIIAGDYSHLQAPGTIALVAAIVSILTKEGMFWYTRHYAKILDSAAFMADAWHHRSDAFSSVGSLIGIGGAMFGFPVLDPLASVVICIFILKVAFDIFKDALDKMLDTSCSEEYEEKLADYIRKSRGFTTKAFPSLKNLLISASYCGATLTISSIISFSGITPRSSSTQTGFSYVAWAKAAILFSSMPISRIASSGWNLTITFPISNIMFLIIYFFSYNPAPLPAKSNTIC